MIESDLVMWLSGFLEMRDGPLSEEEVKCIKDHLALVVTKVTPEYISKVAKAEEIKAHPNHNKSIRTMPFNPHKRIC